MELLALTLVLGATLCWGAAQVLGKIALRKIDSLLFNWIRFTIAILPIILGATIVGELGGIGLNSATLVAIASGVFGWFLATYLFFYSMKREAAHRMIPVGNAYPFWAIALAFLFLGEPPKIILPLSAIMIFSGTLLLSLKEKEAKRWKWGVPIASLVAFLWGANAILNKYSLSQGMNIYTLLVVRVLSAVILFTIALGITSQRRKIKIHYDSVKLSIASGLIAFPIGSLLYLSALQTEGASVLAPITGATVFFGFILSILALGEKPTKKSVLGMILIFTGILIMII